VWFAALLLPILTVAFGAAAYQHARALRGDAPTSLIWISPVEFAGPLNSSIERRKNFHSDFNPSVVGQFEKTIPQGLKPASIFGLLRHD
jgi:hypothetical protein